MDPVQSHPDSSQKTDFRHLAQAGTLKGVGGWLGFFCFVTLVANPIISITDIIRYGSIRRVVIEDVGISLLSVTAGVLVVRESKHALKAVLVLLLAIFVIPLVNVTAFPSKAGLMFLRLRPMIPAIIWWTYFHCSERVRNTFGSNL